MTSNVVAKSKSWRAKLYELENTGTWLDQGTGYVHCDLNSRQDSPSLVMLSEEDQDKVILESKIQSDELYEKQGENLILWKEASMSANVDYALSFQESEGCSAIWTSVRAVQAQYHLHREFGSIPNFSRNSRGQAVSGTAVPPHHSNVYLILPENMSDPNSLQRIKLKLENLHISQRDFVCAQLLNNNCHYFSLLFEKFKTLEKEKAQPELHLLADVVRLLLLLNDPSLIEYLLSDEVFLLLAGIMEYDRSLKLKGRYREFFQRSAIHQISGSILSHEIVSASAFLFRLRFVRDIILHPTIDEPGVSSLNSMITFTSGEICFQVMSDKNSMKKLLDIVLWGYQQISNSNDQETDKAEVKGEIVLAMQGLRFFRELFCLSKFISIEKRIELYRNLVHDNSTSFTSLLLYVLGGASFQLRARTVAITKSSHNEAQKGECGNCSNDALQDLLAKFPYIQTHYFSTFSSSRHKSKAYLIHQSYFFFSFNHTLEAVNIVIEILAAITTACPSLVRQMILENHNSAPSQPQWNPSNVHQFKSANANIVLDSAWMLNNVFFLLIDTLNNAHDEASAELLGDLLKNLLEFDKQASALSPGYNNIASASISNSNGLGVIKAEKDKFLTMFYDHYAPWLMTPFVFTISKTSSNAHNKTATLTTCVPSQYFCQECLVFYLHSCMEYESSQPLNALFTSRRVLFELLCICVATHSYRAKYFLIRGNYLSKLVSKAFLPYCNKSLQLYTIKLLRCILSLKDEFYFRHIEKLDILKPALSLILKMLEQSKDNALTSSMLDLLEVIRAENIVTLIEYIMQSHLKDVDQFGYIPEVVEGLKLRYEQIQEKAHGTSLDSSADIDKDNKSIVDGAINGKRDVAHIDSPLVAKENNKLREIDSEDNYFFSDENDVDKYLREDKKHSNYDNCGSNEQDESEKEKKNFIDSIRHRHLKPTKPPSPPHYSHRLQGSPLDGDSSSSLDENRPAFLLNGLKGLLVHYNDGDEGEGSVGERALIGAVGNDSPPFFTGVEDDEEEGLGGVFLVRKRAGCGENNESNDNDSHSLGGASGGAGRVLFSLTKKKRPKVS